MEIHFYRVSDPYGFFSNFSPHRIFLENVMWYTAEHYFQAKKFKDHEIVDKIRSIESPNEVALLGRKREHPLRKDWEEVKETVMMKGIKAKFLQHPHLRKQLLKTGDAIIIEHTINDSYWADGGDDSGKNRLGVLLMALRDELKLICDDSDIILPPWVAFADIDKEDLFWRMGLGENYLNNWMSFYMSLNSLARDNYDGQFPPTKDWENW